MNADLHAAYRYKDWTFYGQVGRELERRRPFTLDSSEYWIGRQPEEGFGFRAGRFLPAYGIRFADHTSYNRQFLGLTQYDQILGVELSHSRGRYLTQVSLGPGRAETVIDDDGDAAFTATGRLQIDLDAADGGGGIGALPRRHGLRCASGMRQASRSATRRRRASRRGRSSTGSSSTGRTARRTSSSTRPRSRSIAGSGRYVSPQARFGGGEQIPDLLRFGLGAVLLPRTHFNVNVSYYRDRNRTSDITTNIFLAQFHLYL